MIAKSNSSDEDRPEIPITPIGTYVSVCRGVIGIGTHNTGFKDPETKAEIWQNQVVILFELPTERIEIGGKDVPRGINTFPLTISLGKKANLRKMIENWRGREFTDTEAAQGFDMELLLAQNCLMSVIHKKSKGDPTKTYANIGGVLPMVKGTPTFEPENEVIYYEIDTGMVIPLGTPEWLKMKIFESREMMGHSREDETGQQNDGPHVFQSEIAESERITEQMVNEEFGVNKGENDPF